MYNTIKKTFLTAALLLASAGCGYAAMPALAQEECQATETSAPCNGCQAELIPATTPSEEVDYVQESSIAQKMTQAEKAHNAAVNDSWGGAITIIAMCIVISALAVLSILFLIFGKISQRLLARNTRTTNVAAVAAGNAVAEEHHDVDSGDVIAAIAAALSEHFAEGHDFEETILTIRKLQKAYSPWSSKIYNLRTMPDHRRNTPGKATF